MAQNLVSPDRGCVQADVGRRRYSGNIVTVHDPNDAKMLKAVGYFVKDEGGVPRADGYVCTACGRRVWFTTCGKCGSPAERP